jgi:hypothetical protein
MTLPTITRAMADTYFATTPRLSQWNALTIAEMDTFLTEAQTWLKTLCWDEKADCCGNNFDQQFTRAVSELALALHGNPTALIGGAAATNSGPIGPVKRQKLDALEIEYFEPGGGSSAASGSRFGPKAPLVLRTFPWLWDICGCWIKNSGSNQLAYRVRS